GREVDRLCVLELERPLERGAAEVPDAAGELADAVTALRLATAAPLAAGPVLFERLDWRPYGIRPVLPIAATAPPGEPTRLDPFRASVAARLRPRLALADDDACLADALDRWELSLFQDDPFRGEQLRQALDAAFGERDGLWAAAMRGAASSRSSSPAPAAGCCTSSTRLCSGSEQAQSASRSCERADTSGAVRFLHGRGARGTRTARADRGARARGRTAGRAPCRAARA